MKNKKILGKILVAGILSAVLLGISNTKDNTRIVERYDANGKITEKRIYSNRGDILKVIRYKYRNSDCITEMVFDQEEF